MNLITIILFIYEDNNSNIIFILELKIKISIVI
jgi:hypothetical protein